MGAHVTLDPRWVKPLLWTVRIGASVIIAIAAGFWFGAPPASPVSPLRAEMSFTLGDGRQIDFYLGPPAVTKYPPAGQALLSHDTISIPQSSAAEPHVTPIPAAVPIARTRTNSTADALELCMLGSGVVSKASFKVSESGAISAYGIADAVAVDRDRLNMPVGFALPLLQRVRAQGALIGMQLQSLAANAGREQLPNLLSAADGGEAGDYAMGVAHGVVDLLVVGNGDFATELNPWYHSLNSGMRAQIIGRMGCNQIIGAHAVVPSEGGLASSASAMRRSFSRNAMYVSDGHSQLLDLTVNGHHVDSGPGNEVRLAQPGIASISAVIEAELPRDPPADSNGTGWNIEHARRGTSRFVTVEIVANGKPVASQQILADGSAHAVKMDILLPQSGWIALRLMGAGHSNPIYVLVDNKPVRASRSSVEWNLQALTRAYEAKSSNWTPEQAPLASAAYYYAFAVYNRILKETTAP